ncbi:DUF3613 domain-containing protein [Ralstonia sp. CHL-2022]|jgi:hypothetical protein|uniref:DUF3613 domain-containing protein n=1 Tax=Ralstonia mojiangensis TaxID=2953895 RepID=A0ABT2LB32_9RALS|nr:DUF3613 domain-containing protein [Ralstonia mojiangensis]MCT7298304.1 DUF3613 domain-containing protein [Ralstonia mojiangensis]MCT7312641.1 DUF3613 domain-containing protein [Ralstonia mojiangensis]
MIPRILMAAGMAVWLLSNPAGAQGFSGGNPQNATQAAPNVGSNMGDATRALLKAQREGTYAGEFVPLRGEQAALAYQRYLDSFSRPMPGLSQTAPSAKSTSSSQATTAR